MLYTLTDPQVFLSTLLLNDMYSWISHNLSLCGVEMLVDFCEYGTNVLYFLHFLFTQTAWHMTAVVKGMKECSQV